MNQNLVSVCGCPHPFRTTRVDEMVEAGGTLEQIITRGLDSMNVPDFMRDCGHAYIGARYIPREEWATTVPLPGDFVTYRIFPQKGGGKNPLRTLLTLAVIVVASFVSMGVSNLAVFGAGGALAGFGGVAGAMAAGAITAAGMLAVNALVPIKPPSLPSASSETDSTTYSISGARNTMNPFGTVPVLLGRHRITPPQGAKPFTEIVGNDQYVRQLFILGYSDIALVSEIRIGDTPLSYYKDVQWEFIPEASPSVRPKYYSWDVNEEALSIQLKEAEGWQFRTTPQECDRFSFDISFPRGLVEFKDNGNKIPRSVIVDALYRKVGDAAWINITGEANIFAEEFKISRSIRPTPYVLCCSPSGDVELRNTTAVPPGYFGIYSFQINWTTLQNVVSILPPGSTGFGLWKSGGGLTYVKVTLGAGTLPMGDFVTTSAQTTALRRSFSVNPGAKAFYEVAIRRVSADTADDKIVDETWWGALRAIALVAPIQFPKPLAALSIRIKATGQLNGVIDELNMDAVTVCKDWDYQAMAWVERPTDNPASLFRHVLQHPANPRPVSDTQIDLSGLQAWHNFCRINGFSYNRYHDFSEGVYSVLQGIASAGRAAVSRPDGRWGVVVDEPRTRVVQHFTPGNSSGFSATKALPKLPHGWRVRFINEQVGYQSDERIVYDDTHNAGNATEFEGLELPGVTDPAQVWKLARYHYAVAKLRPEEYEFYADMEHIVCTRGDLIRMAHDVPLWGVAQGRVKAVVGQFVTVDNPCEMRTGTRYTARFRLQTGESLLREVVCVNGANQTIELMGTGTLPAVGDVFMFGELGVESSDLLVKFIEPAANFSARVIAVDYSPEVFSADSGTIPAFQTSITNPYASSLKYPPVPVIRAMRSDELVLAGVRGSLVPRIAISFNAKECDFINARVRPVSGEWVNAGSVDVANGEIYVSDVNEGEEYEISLRAVSAGGLASPWSPAVRHTVIGRTTAPPAPINVYLDGTVVYWTMPEYTPKDIVGWEILASSNVDYPINWAAHISTGVVTEQRFDVGPWTGRTARVWVRTVDEVGLKSGAVSVVIGLGDAEVANVVQTISEADLLWPGHVLNGVVLDGELSAGGSSAMWDASSMWDSDVMWGNTFLAMQYVGYETADPDVAGAFLRVNPVAAAGAVALVEYARGLKRQIWAGDPMWGTLSMWGGAEVTEWVAMPDKISVQAGDEIYVRVTTHDGSQAVISDLELIYDVEDAEHSINGLELTALGGRLDVPPNHFRWIKTVTFGLEYSVGSTATGVRYLDKGIITDGVVTAGPLVQCIDSTGAPVAGRIDARIQGAAFGG